MQTLYANIVNFRVTPSELVLEFGNFFPDRPNVGPPQDFKPDIRIVLSVTSLPGLAEAFKNAAAQKQQTQEMERPTVGFKQ
jgi:hypothetical protein